MSQLVTGLAAMDAAATGTLAASGGATVSGAAATATTNTYAMVGGAWHATAGFFLAASSGANVLQTEHVISLEPDPAKRARLQYAYTLFTRTAQLVGIADFVVSKVPLVRAMARNYLKGRIFLTLGAQKAAFDKQAATLVAGSLKTEAASVQSETVDLFHDLRGIATDSEAGFLGKVNAIVQRAADHGALVRASGQSVGDAHKLAGEIALRGPTWYVHLMNTLSDEQMMKLDVVLATAGRTAAANAAMLNAVRLACDEAAVEATVKFYRRVFAPEPTRP